MNRQFWISRGIARAIPALFAGAALTATTLPACAQQAGQEPDQRQDQTATQSEVEITAELNRAQASNAQRSAQAIAEFEASRAGHTQELAQYREALAAAEAEQRSYEEALAVWEANKTACLAGEYSRCTGAGPTDAPNP